MNRHVVIVDPYSSGRYLAPAFKSDHNIHSIAVLSPGLDAQVISEFQSADFCKVFHHEGDLHRLVDALKPFHPLGVIPGSDPGVLLANQIAVELGLPHDDPSIIHLRHDKFLSTERLREKKLNAIPQLLTTSLKEAIDWVTSYAALPCVLKPNNGSGSEMIALCRSLPEIEQYFATYLNRKTFYGHPMEKVLIQKCMVGEEYVVDSVSFEGQHYVTSIWKYEKGSLNGSDFIYYSTQLLSSLTPQEEALCPYALACLDALGVSHGAAHTEIMLTEQGPFLIEVNARMHGSIVPMLCKSHIGYSQVDLITAMHADPALFKKNTPHHYPFPPTSLLGVLLHSPCEGIFNGFRHVDKLLALPNVDGFFPHISPGEPIAKTTDFETVPARVSLTGTKEALALAYERIREWEKSAYDCTP